MPPVHDVVEIINVLVSVVRNVALKRAISGIDPAPPLNFWRLVDGNAIDMAVLDWCKLFGSDDEQGQQIHWKNVVDDVDGFRAAMFAELHIDQTGWNTYWGQIKTYRDEFVAHHDLRRDRQHPLPDLDLAIASTCSYYGHLTRHLEDAGVADRYPLVLHDYYDDVLAQTRRIAVAAMAAALPFEERVF